MSCWWNRLQRLSTRTTLGLTSCKGKLIVTGYNIEYLPNEPKDKNHGFIQTYGELKEMKDDQKGGLSLVFSNKRWDFRPAVAGKPPSESKASDTLKIVDKIKRIQDLRKQLNEQ